MTCPYCGSKKKAEEFTARTYDLPMEWIAINHVRCAKCGESYSKTIRQSAATGKRKVSVSKNPSIRQEDPFRPAERKGIRSKLFRGWRR